MEERKRIGEAKTKKSTSSTSIFLDRFERLDARELGFAFEASIPTRCLAADALSHREILSTSSRRPFASPCVSNDHENQRARKKHEPR
jgi:hypothetical protein